jgi:hypothetical protein
VFLENYIWMICANFAVCITNPGIWAVAHDCLHLLLWLAQRQNNTLTVYK